MHWHVTVFARRLGSSVAFDSGYSSYGDAAITAEDTIAAAETTGATLLG